MQRLEDESHRRFKVYPLWEVQPQVSAEAGCTPTACTGEAADGESVVSDCMLDCIKGREILVFCKKRREIACGCGIYCYRGSSFGLLP